MTLCNKKLKGIKIRTEVCTFQAELNIPMVSVYGDPKSDSLERSVAIENADDYEIEIIKSDQLVSVIMNLSNLPQAPANSVIAGIIKIDFGQSTAVPKFHLIGTQEQKMYLSDAEFGLMEFGT